MIARGRREPFADRDRVAGARADGPTDGEPAQPEDS